MPVAIRWFPPSWFQIKFRGRIIYIDPAYLRSYYTRYPKKIEFSKWPDPIDGLPEKLERADLILVTHHHKDHVKDVTVNRLKRKHTRVVAPFRCTKILGKDIRVVKPGDEFSFQGIAVKAVDAYNTSDGNSTRKVHHKGDGVGYLLTAAGKTIYHAGDTDFIPEMKNLGRLELALLPIGGTFTMDPGEAVSAATTIRPKAVIPMHRSKADIHAFKKEVEARSNIKVHTVQIGEFIELQPISDKCGIDGRQRRHRMPVESEVVVHRPDGKLKAISPETAKQRLASMSPEERTLFEEV